MITLSADLESYLVAMRDSKHVETEAWHRLERSILQAIGELRKLGFEVRRELPRNGIEVVK